MQRANYMPLSARTDNNSAPGLGHHETRHGKGTSNVTYVSGLQVLSATEACWADERPLFVSGTLYCILLYFTNG